MDLSYSFHLKLKLSFYYLKNIYHQASSNQGGDSSIAEYFG